MKNSVKKIMLVLLLASSAVLSSCSGNVGVGLSVGIPIGNHGYMSLGTSSWH
jgi:hypothetical protein